MKVGIVVIGRNEGNRLAACLESARSSGCPVVYVDSGSADGSLERAIKCGLNAIALDPARPFSAARARNEGFERLLALHAEIRYVQVLDGDCTLAGGWLDAAAAALDGEPARAAVTGRLVERNAQASVYNRLCQLEWDAPPGDLADFGRLGGISMIRASVFRELGGFRSEVIAGEDSEFGVRMSLAGYRVTRLDAAMATHDAEIRRFSQWWRRAVRAGHAIGQRSQLHGNTPARDCVRERASTIFWGVALPLAIVLSAAPTRGAGLIFAAGYPLLGLRVWWRRLRAGDSTADALIYAVFIVIGKFANAVGILTFYLNHLSRRYEIIEYK